MEKTVEKLKKQAELKGITFYSVHNCSMCGYNCGYRIGKESIFYDCGCYCSMQPQREESWEELTKTYNMNQPENNSKISKEFLGELNKTWQFENKD